MKTFAPVMILLAALTGTARGYSYLGASCDGATIDIHLSIFNDIGEEYVGLPIIVKQRQVGTCAAEVVLPTPTLVVPAFISGYETEFTVAAPEPDLYYTFTAYVVLEDGTHAYLAWASHAAGCGEAVAGRGYLDAGGPLLVFTPCATACWDGVLQSGSRIDVSALAPDQYQWAVGTGIAVDLYGAASSPGGFPDTPHLFVTRILPVPDGDCATVAAEIENWGSFKARYR